MDHFAAWRFALALKCIAVITADCLPPPRSLSYAWTDPFHVGVTWQRPRGLSERCCYLIVTDEKEPDPTKSKNLFYKRCITTDEMSDKGLKYSIAAIQCSASSSLVRNRSSPVNVVIPRPPKLLKDVSCVLHSSSAMNCSWTPTAPLPDMKVYYRSCENPTSSLMACKNLSSNGCYLDTKGFDLTADVCVLINGTLGGAPVWNTFKRRPYDKVRPRPPDVTVTAMGNQLRLSWTPQRDIVTPEHCWDYKVSYSKCKEPAREVTVQSGLVLNITYDDSCRYKVQVRANFRETCGGDGGSDNSEAVMHGMDAAPDLSVALAVVIPVLVSASLSVLACYCFRRHKAIFWPIIPDPSVIFKDLVENSKEQRTTIGSLYAPVEVDVEVCKVRLVADEGSPLQGS